MCVASPRPGRGPPRPRLLVLDADQLPEPVASGQLINLLRHAREPSSAIDEDRPYPMRGRAFSFSWARLGRRAPRLRTLSGVALSADQQAMLQLLLERGQSYADLASLLGVDEAEVRARARATLTELAGADPDRHVGLTDYLLGQADPIGRADAVRHLKDDPADLELATEVAQKIRLIAPDAELPQASRRGAPPAPAPRPGHRDLPPPGSRPPAAEATGGRGARERRGRRSRDAGGPAHDAVQAPDPARGGTRQRRGAGGDDRAWGCRSVQQRRRRRRRPVDHHRHHDRREHGPPGVPAHRGQDRQSGDFQDTFAIRHGAPGAAASDPGRLRDPGEEARWSPRRSRRRSRAGNRSCASKGKTCLHRHRQLGKRAATASYRFRSEAKHGRPGLGRRRPRAWPGPTSRSSTLKLTRGRAAAQGLGLHRLVRARLGPGCSQSAAAAPILGTLALLLAGDGWIGRARRSQPERWQPPPEARWQYQLESANRDLAPSGGIDVEHLQAPRGGGACVRPDVFDIDLYVDARVSGNNHTINTAAVEAIHDRGATRDLLRVGGHRGALSARLRQVRSVRPAPWAQPARQAVQQRVPERALAQHQERPRPARLHPAACRGTDREVRPGEVSTESSTTTSTPTRRDGR